MLMVPVGALEGLPAVAVGPADLKDDVPGCLVDRVLRLMATGIRPEVVMVSSMDWERAEPALAELAGNPATAHLTLWHQRGYGDPTWPPVVSWIVEDVSVLLAGEVAISDLTMSLADRPPSPAPTELVVIEPHANTTHRHLDELAAMIGPSQSWLYAKNRRRFRGIIGRTRDTWGLRGRPA